MSVCHAGRARDAVAQHARIAEQEIGLVAGLQRQRVERMINGEVFEHARSGAPAATDQRGRPPGRGALRAH